LDRHPSLLLSFPHPSVECCQIVPPPIWYYLLELPRQLHSWTISPIHFFNNMDCMDNPEMSIPREKKNCKALSSELKNNP
jgi:hypothetical protein